MAIKQVEIPTVSVFLRVSLLLLLKLLKQTAVGFTMFNIFNYFEANSKILAMVILSAFLTACGAGGAGSEATSSEASVDTSTEAENEVEVVDNVMPVVITTQPKSILVNEGSEALFTVAATGGGPLNFQWNKGGIELAGETSSSLVLSNTGVSNSGQYSVVVANSLESLVDRSRLA